MANIQEEYIHDVTKEFITDVKQYFKQVLSQRISCVQIEKRLKFHLHKIFEKTDEYKLMKKVFDKHELSDIEADIVNKAYAKVHPIIEKCAKAEREDKPKPTIKSRFQARPSFFGSLLRGKTMKRFLGTEAPPRNRSANNITMTNRGSSNVKAKSPFNMSQLTAALDDM